MHIVFLQNECLYSYFLIPSISLDYSMISQALWIQLIHKTIKTFILCLNLDPIMLHFAYRRFADKTSATKHGRVLMR